MSNTNLPQRRHGRPGLGAAAGLARSPGVTWRLVAVGMSMFGAAVFGLPAAAGDRPAGPSNIAAPYGWSGFYAGIHAGYGWGSTRSALETLLWGVPTPLDSVDLEEIPGAFRINSSGFIGGGQVGYNKQINRFVLGIEADLTHSEVKGDHTASGTVTSGGPPVTQPFTSSQSNHLEWLATVRGRLGYMPQDSLLLYATGGLAVGRVETSTMLAFGGFAGTTFVGSDSSTRTGWTIGAGGELALDRTWSFKLEYLYFDLGDTRLDGIDTVSPNQPFQTRAHFEHNGHIVRAGLNLKLD